MARRLLTVSAALVLALLGTMLVVTYVGRADARALEGVETVHVLVATGPVDQGTTVAEARAADLIGTELLARKVVPPGALAELGPQDDTLVFASDVTEGEVLQRPRLAEATAGGGGLAVPDGMLAVTVELDDAARVARFVTVGSEVAIFDSYNVFEGSDGGSWTPAGDHLTDDFPKNKATRVLLPRVEVLAIGEETLRRDTIAEPDAAEGTEPLVPVTLVTVAVDQRQAEKLIHGAQTGTLYLGLLGDHEVTPGPGVDNRTLFD